MPQSIKLFTGIVKRQERNEFFLENSSGALVQKITRDLLIRFETASEMKTEKSSVSLGDDGGVVNFDAIHISIPAHL